jgi:hypothetical protein
MFFIRRFEETLLDLFSLGKLVGTTHTYIGQEANAIGLIDHLDPDVDTIFSNHRCHGHYLAFTDDAFGLLCEVMGKAPGVCGGKGGSQHLCKGNFYSNGVLGSIVPVATGIALAEKRKGTGRGLDVFLGDGTLGEGVTYESLNIASLWQLPGAVRRREQPLRAVDARRARARRVDRGTRCSVRRRGRRARHHRRRGRPRGCRPRGRHIRETGAVLPRPQHLSVQPALEVGRPARSGRDRRAPHARSLARRGRAARRGRRRAIEERCEERLAETVDAADSRTAATPGSRREHDRQGKRGVQVLNETLHAIFAERDDVVLFGEDVLDPYGGAVQGDGRPVGRIPRTAC